MVMDPWMSFEKIKETLTSDLFLTHYDPTLDIIVTSDASSYVIGACIHHKLPDGSQKAVAHASRSLLPAEKQYSLIERDSRDNTRRHKIPKIPTWKRFILQTDHKPLIAIFGSKKGLPVYNANRLLHWGTILLNYNFKILFLTSKNICHTDKNMIANTIKELPVTLADIKRESRDDDFIQSIKNKIHDKDPQCAWSFLPLWWYPTV